MPRLESMILIPSRSSKSIKNTNTRNSDGALLMKEDRYLQTDQTMDDLTTCLNGIHSTSHEETLKTAKQFIQVDTHALRTYQALEKTSRTLDLLLDQKMDMLSTVSTLTKIQTNLGLEQLAKYYLTKSSH